VGKFGSATYEEFVEALSKLKMQGAEKYIIDLRENSGGYLQAAIFMINEFLEEGEMIVYTQGKAQKREDAIADGTGEFQDAPVAILIDEWSASASEIFAGAIQDNDRGVVIGRRSFGKGLVQEQIPMRDGSAVRLTIARYYTPSGRCIQKPYDNIDNYEKEVYERYINGELDSDSAKTPSDSMKYYTKNGRVVYGGGGITPDIIITRDTLGATPYYIKLHNSGTLYEYAFRYVDNKRKELTAMTEEELCKFLNKEPLAQLAMDYGTDKKITTLLPVKKETKELIQRRVKEYVVKDVLGDQSYFSVVNQNDNIIKAALKELNKKDNKKKINK
jgi:carboxyl-terminal processing protease